MKENCELISKVLQQSFSAANCGVRAFVLADGQIMTNSVAFRSSRMAREGMTHEEREHALNEWRRLTSPRTDKETPERG